MEEEGFRKCKSSKHVFKVRKKTCQAEKTAEEKGSKTKWGGCVGKRG
jgi:hypothetical protein